MGDAVPPRPRPHCTPEMNGKGDSVRMLMLQALLFYLPTIVWHGLNQKAGVDADSILAAAHTFSRTDRVENRDRTLKMLVNQMDRFLHSRRQPNRLRLGRLNCSCGLFGRR